MMAPNRKQAAIEGGPGVLTKFAGDLGCIGGLDTIPPHQYKSEQDRRYRLHRRLLAWLRDHTLPYRSHYAVDAKGKPLTLKHAAAHLDVDDLPAIHHAWRDMEKENRVYRGTGERKLMASIKGREVFAAPAPVGSLCLSGYFEMPPLFVQTNDSSTKQRDLAHLTPELRAEFIAEEKLDKEVFDLAHKRWLAALRFRMDQKENSRCARYAVKCLRAEKYGDEQEQAKRRAAVQELLPHIEEFVQTIEQETLYKSSPGLVQTTAAGTNGHLNGHANGSYKKANGVLSDSSPESDLKRREACLPQAKAGRPVFSLSNRRTEELKALLFRWLGTTLPHQMPGAKLLDDIQQTLVTATFADLARAIQERQKKLPKIESYGICLELAKQCEWKASQPKPDPEQPKPQTAAEKFAEEYNARKSRATTAG
jgi:hypothetical protein